MTKVASCFNKTMFSVMREKQGISNRSSHSKTKFFQFLERVRRSVKNWFLPRKSGCCLV